MSLSKQSDQRLFVAIQVPLLSQTELLGMLKESLPSQYSSKGITQIHWQEGALMHITLGFIGTCKEKEKNEIMGLMNEVGFDTD